MAATVRIAVLADAAAAKAELRSVGQESSRLGSTLKTGLAVTAGLAVSSIGALGKIGLSTAANLEQSEIAFTTMLGSAQDAKTFLGDLSDFAAKTPFDLPGLQTAASSLVSAGVSARDVIPIMTTLGDVTSGMGTGAEGIQRATVALQQMQAAQRISGEDLNQLRDAGIPVYDLLAAATGRSKQAIVELAQSGKLGKKDLDALFTALKTGNGLERFSGLMEKQSQSLAGLWSTVKDQFSIGLADAIQPSIPLIKDLLGAVSSSLPTLLNGLSGAIRPAVLSLQGAFAAFQGEGVTSDGMVGAFERAGVAARQLVDAFKGAQAGGSGADFGGLMDSLASSVSTLAPAMATLAQAGVSPLVDGLTLGSDVLGFFASHADTLAKVMPLLVAGILAYKVAQLAANVAAALSVPVKIAEVVVNRQLVASNRALVASRAGVVAPTVAATVAETASTTAKSAGFLATVRSTTATVASAVAQRAVALATGVWTAAQWLLNAALTANPIGLVILAVAGLIAVIVLVYRRSETFRRIVQAAFSGVLTAARAVWSWIRGNWPLLLAIITGPIGIAVGLVVRNFDRIQAAVRAIPGRIRAVFSGARNLLTGAGRAVVDGFLAGITRGWRFVTAKVNSLVNAIPGPVRRLLGIASPSKVFRRIGQQTGEGLALGLADQTSLVQRAARRLAAVPAAVAVKAPALSTPTLAINRGTGRQAAQTITLEVVGGAGQLEQLLVKVLRDHVRIRGGGNVQVALGTGRG